MTEPDRIEEAHRWLPFAEEDLLTAETLQLASNIPPRHACWLAQQGAEKALKAVLVFLEIDFPWRHDLDGLRNLLPNRLSIRHDHPDLSRLTSWAIESRYPGTWSEATEDDARAAVEQARSVYQSAVRDLAAYGFDG